MAVVPEHAVGRARRRPREGGAHGRPYSGRVGAEQPEDLYGQLVPGRLARAGRVVDAGPGRRAGQRDDLVGDIDRPGGLPPLVGDDIDERPLGFQADHRPDEIGPVRPVQPGGPHHIPGLGKEPEDGLLPGQFGAPVGGARRGVVILRVGSNAIPAEHVVGGHVHQPGAAGRARGGDVLRASPVDQEGLVLASLGIIDGGPGRAVHDDGGPGAQDEGADGRGVCYVEVRAPQAGHVLAPAVQDTDKVPAEHPASPGDQPFRHGAPWALAERACSRGPGSPGGDLSGSHQERLSRYHCTVARRPSANGVRGA